MITIETVLIGLFGGLIGFKVALLAAAAVLFAYGMARRSDSNSNSNQPALEPARMKVRRPKLDLYA